MAKSEQCVAWSRLIDGIPFEAGLYSVWAGDVLLYIGVSERLWLRLSGHDLRNKFLECGANRVLWMLCPDRTARFETERHLSLVHKPMLCRMKFRVPVVKTTIKLAVKDGLPEAMAYLDSVGTYYDLGSTSDLLSGLETA